PWRGNQRQCVTHQSDQRKRPHSAEGILCIMLFMFFSLEADEEGQHQRQPNLDRILRDEAKKLLEHGGNLAASSQRLVGVDRVPSFSAVFASEQSAPVHPAKQSGGCEGSTPRLSVSTRTVKTPREGYCPGKQSDFGPTSKGQLDWLAGG